MPLALYKKMKSKKQSRLNVMLVDENPDRAANVRAALEANGCKVVSLLASPMLELLSFCAAHGKGTEKHGKGAMVSWHSVKQRAPSSQRRLGSSPSLFQLHEGLGPSLRWDDEA